MNFREPTQASLGARRAFRCFTLLLVATHLPKAMLAGISVHIQIGQQGGKSEESSPYLAAEGCPPLAFREPDPAPGMLTRPTADGPPVPHLTSEETSVAKANTAASHVLPPKVAREDTPVAEDPDAAPAASKAPISILPDTVRPPLQAEDFLPYFVIPDSAKSSSAAPVPSEPGKLPASSATYTEK
jgi:hypothetical protein